MFSFWFIMTIFCSNTSLANSFLDDLSSLKPKSKPIFIQIFKQEQRLDLYQQKGIQYELIKSYPICKYSGGLGPKKRQGDFKSPEGFYSADISQLKPDSQYHRAINVGFPNEYDRQYGYTGDYLMIHGDCVSVGCYAMLDGPMQEIYEYAEAALYSGQTSIPIHIYPFEMTESNLSKYKGLEDYDFWVQLSAGYNYFKKNKRPPEVEVYGGKYVVTSKLQNNQMLASSSEHSIDRQNKKPFTSQSYKIQDMIDYNKHKGPMLTPTDENEQKLLNSIKLAQEQPNF